MFADSADTIELPKRKRNADDGELDVTPMIDVVKKLLVWKSNARFFENFKELIQSCLLYTSPSPRDRG